jgi:hypothetical protein
MWRKSPKLCGPMAKTEARVAKTLTIMPPLPIKHLSLHTLDGDEGHDDLWVLAWVLAMAGLGLTILTLAV